MVEYNPPTPNSNHLDSNSNPFVLEAQEDEFEAAVRPCISRKNAWEIACSGAQTKPDDPNEEVGFDALECYSWRRRVLANWFGLTTPQS